MCAVPSAFGFQKGAANYLTSAWGATMTVKPSKPTYVKFGIYEDESSLALANQNAWPGPDWSLQRSTGATIPVEIGYMTTVQNAVYPHRYDIGGFYDTGNYADPLYNNKGQTVTLSGGTPLQDRGRSGLYLQAEQTIWRPDPSTDRRLELFGTANWATSGEAPVAREFVLGLWDKGQFASRPNDIFGADVVFAGFNPRLTEAINEKIIKAGNSGQVSGQETMFEVNYAIAVAPGIAVEPFAQYVMHPDQYTLPKPSGNVTHSLMVGIGLTINFNDAFGMPQLSRGGY
jgi:carbohydrate-selective porin OprB